MASQLTYRPLENLGVNGLNTQHNPTSIDNSWLTKADNIVLKESGHVSFRKGLKQKVLSNTDGAAGASLPIGSVVEHFYQTNKVFAGIGSNIYELDFNSPDAPWTNGFNTSSSDSDWQFINFNNRLFALQAGETPLRYDGGTWAADISSPDGVTIFDPSCGTGYYGRLWVGGVSSSKDVVYYSDTLIGNNFSQGSIEVTDSTTGIALNKTVCEGAGHFYNSINNICYTVPTYAGVIDLKSVWGQDEIVAIAPFYGQLAIFGKHNIAIYKNPQDPNDMSLVEVIRGIGCVSRDTVQAVGDDLVFLSDTGLRSLNRTSEKDNVPMQDFSHAIKDSITRNIGQSSNVKAIYVQNEGVYILSFVDMNVTYVFDFKHFTPLKTPRVTMWSFLSDRQPSSLTYTESFGLLIGQKKGSIATYTGYYDKDYIGNLNYSSSSYAGKFTTAWIEVTDGSVASLLKKAKAIISGGSGSTVGIQWYRDFMTTSSGNLSFLLHPAQGGEPAIWGASESQYGVSTYAPVYGYKEYNIPLSGSAKHLKLEMTATANGYAASLTDITLLYKAGKIR